MCFAEEAWYYMHIAPEGAREEMAQHLRSGAWLLNCELGWSLKQSWRLWLMIGYLLYSVQYVPRVSTYGGTVGCS